MSYFFFTGNIKDRLSRSSSRLEEAMDRDRRRMAAPAEELARTHSRTHPCARNRQPAHRTGGRRPNRRRRLAPAPASQNAGRTGGAGTPPRRRQPPAPEPTAGDPAFKPGFRARPPSPRSGNRPQVPVRAGQRMRMKPPAPRSDEAQAGSGFGLVCWAQGRGENGGSGANMDDAQNAPEQIGGIADRRSIMGRYENRVLARDLPNMAEGRYGKRLSRERESKTCWLGENRSPDHGSLGPARPLTLIIRPSRRWMAGGSRQRVRARPRPSGKAGQPVPRGRQIGRGFAAGDQPSAPRRWSNCRSWGDLGRGAGADARPKVGHLPAWALRRG